MLPDCKHVSDCNIGISTLRTLLRTCSTDNLHLSLCEKRRESLRQERYHILFPIATYFRRARSQSLHLSPLWTYLIMTIAIHKSRTAERWQYGDAHRCGPVQSVSTPRSVSWDYLIPVSNLYRTPSTPKVSTKLLNQTLRERFSLPSADVSWKGGASIVTYTI